MYPKVPNKVTGKIYIVAETRVSELSVDKSKSGTDIYEVLDNFSGASLVGTKYLH